MYACTYTTGGGDRGSGIGRLGKTVFGTTSGIRVFGEIESFGSPRVRAHVIGVRPVKYAGQETHKPNIYSADAAQQYTLLLP